MLHDYCPVKYSGHISHLETWWYNSLITDAYCDNFQTYHKVQLMVLSHDVKCSPWMEVNTGKHSFDLCFLGSADPCLVKSLDLQTAMSTTFTTKGASICFVSANPFSSFSKTLGRGKLKQSSSKFRYNLKVLRSDTIEQNSG